MKTVRIIYFIGLIVLLGACSDWLDVKPRTEVQEDDIYNSEDGFRSILNGIYIRMADAGMYGKNLTMYMPELLARHWTLNYPQLPYYIGNCMYTDANVESMITSMWKNYFECIAHLNDVLTNAELHRDVFTEAGYNLLIGEAVGLRAFLHFELLRWFGPVPEKGLDETVKAIPYVEELTKDPYKLQLQSYGEVIAKIIRDLDRAEEFLKNDPIVNSLDNKNTGAEDEWLRFRQSRFNLYAVKGTKARYYQWINRPEQAVKYAREVVEAVNDDGTTKFLLADEAYMTSPGNDLKPNLVFLREHLFGVHNPKLQSIVQPLFKPATGTPALYLSNKNDLETGFEAAVNPDDIRYTGQRYWSGLFNNFQKFTENGENNVEHTIPLMRVAEMYLILMEELPVEEAKAYFSVFRKARNMTAAMEQSFLTETAVRLEKEYRKEFYGEGVMFFYYKRHKTTRFTWPGYGAMFRAENYVLPVPASVEAFE